MAKPYSTKTASQNARAFSVLCKVTIIASARCATRVCARTQARTQRQRAQKKGPRYSKPAARLRPFTHSRYAPPTRSPERCFCEAPAPLDENRGTSIMFGAESQRGAPGGLSASAMPEPVRVRADRRRLRAGFYMKYVTDLNILSRGACLPQSISARMSQPASSTAFAAFFVRTRSHATRPDSPRNK